MKITVCAFFFLFSAATASAGALPPEYIYPPKGQAQPPAEVVKCLALVPVQYYDYNGKLTKGEIVVNRDLVPDVQRIFKLIEETRFPIKSVEPMQKYGWDDDKALDADNTSSYNYRKVGGSSSLSYHAMGRAIDMNSRCNPFIQDGKVSPPGAVHDPKLPCAVDGKKGKQILEAFKAMGWTWGGDWTSPKDYQHFQKPGVNGKKPPYCR